MKKIAFKNVYICQNCHKKIVGYVNVCPICKTRNIVKSEENKIVTFVKKDK